MESGSRPPDQDHKLRGSEDPPPPCRARMTIKATAALAPGRGGGWGPVPSAPPSPTRRRTLSCSGPPPRPARRKIEPENRKTPGQERDHQKKSRLSLTLARTAARRRASLYFYLVHVRLLPQALRGVHGLRCLEPSQCSRCAAGENVRFWVSPEEPRKHGLVCDVRGRAFYVPPR